jgi:hypothetical protein
MLLAGLTWRYHTHRSDDEVRRWLASSQLMQRWHAYELHVRVPKDVAGSYGKKTHVVRSLGTSDYLEAVRVYPDALAEIRRGFAEARARLAPTVKPIGSATAKHRC